MTDNLNTPSQWAPRTARGIPYRRVTIGGSAEQGFQRVTERLVIQVSQVDNFIQESLPPPTIAANGTEIFNNRFLPGTAFRTKQIDWEPLDPTRPIDPYEQDPDAVAGTYGEFALVTILYETEKEKDPDDPDTIWEVSATTAAEVIHGNAPIGSWESFSDENAQPLTASTKLVPQTEWTLTRPNVSTEYWRDTLSYLMRQAMGKVNSSKISLPSILGDSPPETFLFVGYDLDEDPDGLKVSITCKFLEKYIEDSTANVTRHTPRFIINGEEQFTNEERAAGDAVGYRAWNDFWKEDFGWQRLFFKPNTTLFESFDMNRILISPDVVEA